MWRGLWYPLGLLIVLAFPSQVWLGQPFWSLQANTLPSILLMGVAYAVAVLVFTLASAPDRSRISLALLTVLALFAAAYAFRFLRQDLPFSRGVIGISVIITLLAVLLGESVRGRGRPVAFGLAGFVAVISLLMWPNVFGTAEAVATERTREVFLRMAYHPVRARYYNELVMPTDVLGGGAIERVGDGWELFASHLHWRSAEECSVFRVSSLALGPDLEVIKPPESTWQTVFRRARASRFWTIPSLLRELA
jgi:hypothetical protein